MKLKKVDMSMIVEKTEGFSGAEIHAVCTEAGYFAIRSNRTVIVEKDFVSAISKVNRHDKREGTEFLTMFG